MDTPSSPSRFLLLDLRRHQHVALPVHPDISVVNPKSAGECDSAAGAIAVFVAIDGDAAYREWAQRFHPMCPVNFPHVVLLDPYDPQMARHALQHHAEDCCALDDQERIALIVERLRRSNRPACCQEAIPTGTLAHLLRLQATVDTLPIPVFIKDKERRYIACNKAFEQYLGLAAAEIVGKSVFDIAPEEMARIYENADIEHLERGGTQTYETRVRYADGSVRDVIFHKAVFRDAEGNADGIVGAMLDISERKALERRLEVLAATDFLTGTYNLRTFYELAHHEVARMTRQQGDLTLVVMDLDHFKEINDNLGHAAGDEALKRFVQVAQESLREQDIFARAGGDEFRLLLPDTGLSGAYLVAERIREAVNRIIITTPRGEARLSISCGISVCPPGDASLDIAAMLADDALYQAKAAGRNHVFPPPEQGWFPA